MAASNKKSRSIQRMVEQQQAAERYVAGCLLLESSAIYRVLDILQPDSFLLPQAKLVFQAVTGVMEEGRKPDILSVTQRLLQDGTLEEA